MSKTATKFDPPRAFVLDLLRVPEAARRAGIARRQIERALDRGELSWYALSDAEGAHRYVRLIEVIAWVEARRRPRASDFYGGER